MASGRLVIAVDPRKLVTTLGSVFAVPVEVVPFGWETTAKRLRDQGFSLELRVKDDGQPYVTDGQHYILHCNLLDTGFTPEHAADSFKRTVGVVEHGLFLRMTSRVVIGSIDGIQILEPGRP
jgi:ribose 5-phosphate isomerase A